MTNVNTPEYWNRVWLLTGEYRGTRPIYFLADSLVPPEASILDIGCGTGYGLQVLDGREGRIVTGVDYSQKALEACKSPAIQHDIQQPFPFEDATYDLVTCVMTLHCLDTPENAIRESARVLKEEGILLVACPGQHRWKEEYAFLPTLKELQALIAPYFKYVLSFNYDVWKVALATK